MTIVAGVDGHHAKNMNERGENMKSLSLKWIVALSALFLLIGGNAWAGDRKGRSDHGKHHYSQPRHHGDQGNHYKPQAKHHEHHHFASRHKHLPAPHRPAYRSRYPQPNRALVLPPPPFIRGTTAIYAPGFYMGFGW
ncbi:MAG: hypothetical protein VR64_22685 [Desulfatitalea sp. BRH_c12]|nr:MAG: hypothetical protein VR64_22685 [Desulfatitalea sp. BRH_c12]